MQCFRGSCRITLTDPLVWMGSHVSHSVHVLVGQRVRSTMEQTPTDLFTQALPSQCLGHRLTFRVYKAYAKNSTSVFQISFVAPQL